jgi:hypothetical protein
LQRITFAGRISKPNLWGRQAKWLGVQAFVRRGSLKACSAGFGGCGASQFLILTRRPITSSRSSANHCNAFT